MIVLVGIKDDGHIWRELFGKRLLRDAKKKDVWFNNFLELEFLIDEITGEKARHYKCTWRSVIVALDKPTAIKIEPAKDSTPVSDVVKDHLRKCEIYGKYVDQLRKK